MAILEKEKYYTCDSGNSLVWVGLDYNYDSPRDYEFNMGTFYIWHNRYASPDAGCPPRAGDLCEGLGIDYVDHPKAIAERIEEEGLGVALPVWILDHSDVAYQAARDNPFNDPWDSGLAGIIFATNETICELYGVTEVDEEMRARARDELVQEVDVYEHYAAGRVYQFEVYDENGIMTYEGSGRYGDDSALNGIDDELGCLEVTSYDSVEDWVDDLEEMRWEWKDDLSKVDYGSDGLVYLGARCEMAEMMLAEEKDGGYTLDDMLATVDLGNVYAIPKSSRTYGYLEEFWGGHDKMMEGVRHAVEDSSHLYFFTGTGYATHHYDLLGGDKLRVDGQKMGRNAFERYIEEQRSPVTSDITARRRGMAK